ncbi:kinetochore-associated protein NSL1 homolog [Mus musculus]|uniref:NSL1, MIS12 kinetochore complex component n=1 Tax=Mus musculus TaxID=10090 RepID=E9QME3_MOUSE|nr:kinetochore-associated protein NSL1 homolog [Mus musculus]|eukprot:NP_941056.3 kinetochore-associated protein NSL1 homolog [Mus musculus]
MAAVSETVLVSAPQDHDAQAASDPQATAADSPLEDFRVRCTLKRAVMEVMEMCGRFVQELGAVLPEDVRELALRDAQWTFESAVQENVSFNGQAWEEAKEHGLMDSDIKVLEDEFDELIVDVATKRRQYPRRILESVIKTLKAQHASLKQYHPVVHPLDLKCDPDPASRVEDLKCRGEAIAKEMSEAMKALPVLIEQGEGFSQVLKMRPVIQLQRINQEVFSSLYRKADSKPDTRVTHVETTPAETGARKASDIVLKRKKAPDCAQRKRYPLRLQRINLDM